MPVAILTGARALIAFDSDYSLGKLYTFLTEDCKKGFLKGAYDFAMSIFSAEEWAKKITRITDIFTSEKKTGGNAYNSNLSLAFTYMDKGKTGYEQTSMAEGALTEEYYNANYTNIFEEIGRELGKMAFSARAQKYATLFANRLLNKGFNANAASDDLSASIVVGILEFGMMGETSLKSAAEMIYNGSWWDLNEATQRDKNNIAAKYLGKPQKGFNKEKREKFEKMLNAHNTGKYLDIGINAIMISTMIASAPKILVAIDDFLDYIAFKIKMVGKTKVLKTIPNIKPAPEITPAKTATTGNLSAKPVPEITPAKTAVAGNLSAKPVPEITPAKTATTDLTVKAGEITAGKNTSLTTAKELNSNSLAQGSMGLMNKTSAGSKLVDILMPQWLTKTFTNRNIAKTPNSVVPLNSKPLPNEISATKGIPATNKPQKSFFEEEIIRLNKRMGYSDHPIIISLTQHKEEDLIRLIDDFLQGYGFASYVRIYPYGQYTHVLITDNVREHALNAISERIAKISEGKNLTAVQKKALEEILGETTSFLKETKDCLACELGDKIQKFYLKTDEIVNNKEPEKNSFVEEITRLNQTRDIKIVSHDLHTEQELIETIDNLFLGSKNLMSFSYNTQILITDKVREHILNTISEKIAKITAEKELTAVEKRTLDEISREVKYFATARKDYHIIDLQDKIRKFYSKTEEIAGEPSFKEKIIKLNEEMGNDGNTNIVTLSLHREKDLIEAVEKLSKGVKGLKLENLNDDTQILITDTLRDSILNIISEQMAKITAGQELTAAQEKALNEIFEETTSYLKGMKDCSVSELTDIIRNCYLKTENIAGNNPVLRIKALFKDETAFVLHSQQGFLISEKPYSDQDFFKQLDYYVSKLAENKKEFTILLDMHGGIRGEILASDDILSSIPKILKQIRANSGNAKVNIITDSCHGQAIGDFTSQVLDYGFNYLGISSVNNAVYMALNLDHFNNSIEQVFLNAISKGYLGAVLVYEGKVYRPLDYAKKYYTDYEYDPVMLKQIDLLDKMLFGKDPVEAMIELGKQEGYSLRLFNSRWALGKYAENVNNTLTPDEIARIIKRREFKYSLKNLFKKGKSTDYFSFVTNEIESQGSQFIIEFKDSKILALSGPTSKLKYSILKAMQEAFKKDGITISNPTEKIFDL